MSYSTVRSEYLFSDYEATLNNGAEIDSGWLDMATVDKYQFEGLASASGIDLVIESSNVSGGGEADVSSTTSINTTFHLFNVIARQRFMRFRWQNNTGGALTDCFLGIKATYGSSDKLSVFAADVQPSSFSQAALVQAIVRGEDFNGDYQNVLVSDDGELIVTSTEKEFDTRIVIETTGINSTSYCVAVDLSDTTNFFHDHSTGRIDVTNMKFAVERGSTSVGYIKMGVITRIDGTDADIEYGFVVPFTKSDVRRILSVNQFSPSQLKFGYDSGATTKILTNVSETTTSVNTGVTLDSVRGASTVTPAVGDVILKHEHTSGNAWDAIVEFFYHSDESST